MNMPSAINSSWSLAAGVAVGAAAGLCASRALFRAGGERWGVGQAARGNRRVVVAVSGTLQDGFPLRKNLDAPDGAAVFLGWALVRGVRLHLDPKPRGCREHVPPGAGAQNVNPAAVCTGDSQDANIYACYAVTEGAALKALLGEPRGLGMTPDTVLADLNASETSQDLAAMLRVAAVDEFGAGADVSRAALLTVVAHCVPPGAVPLPPLYTKKDGTRVTSFAPSLEAFAGKKQGEEGHAAGLQQALRKAQERAGNQSEDSCYGVSPGTLRLNKPITLGALRDLGARARGLELGAWF
eukprot:CAMPEP_0182870740 /NCGR_PEP_ID=MMETSP0034_2-20130328/10707_1 /TAXON_ID=156128 /ORGANISM="Nephroselmis pyriformis, Strain CCMP717" /LENGTH=296 /DNA_ID=CAMNT_0025003253 /DNA_START=65 /DNA_END=955 /DNA_ORIENTATION=+